MNNRHDSNFLCASKAHLVRANVLSITKDGKAQSQPIESPNFLFETLQGGLESFESFPSSAALKLTTMRSPKLSSQGSR